MLVPRIFSAAAVVLTALVAVAIAMVATVRPPAMPLLPVASDRSGPFILIDDPGPEPVVSDGAACHLPLTPTNPDGTYIVPGVRGASLYHRVGRGAGTTELLL